MTLAWSETQTVDFISFSDNRSAKYVSQRIKGGARGVMVIVAVYGYGDTSSNPGPNWLHFT